MKVYCYVMCVEDGGAPNFEGPAATLALCKPRIRSRAQCGDLVIGFAGKEICHEPDAVVWAGVVSGALTFDEYWKADDFQCKKQGYANRMPDNIYYKTHFGHHQVSNIKHGSKEMQRDLSVDRILILDKFWYFGQNMPVLPDELGLRIVGSRIGHRLRELDTNRSKELTCWLDSQPTAVAPLPRGRACA
jgi:Nucleotide modification associated domain 2